VFDEINGLPMHVLVVHGAVVLVPLTALMGVLFVMPRTHRWAQIPFVLLAVGSVPLVWVAKESGEAFKEYWIGQGIQGVWIDVIETHQERADLLFYLVIAFAVIAVVAFFVARAPNTSKALYQAMCVLVILGAIAVTVQVVRVGDSGSRAAWNPEDNVDFSSTP
jgi:hypothetical protein